MQGPQVRVRVAIKSIVVLSLMTFSSLISWQLFAPSPIFVSFRDHNFNYSVGKATFDKKKFSGISYDFHPNNTLYKIQFFWQGLQVGKEYRWYSNGSRWLEISYRNGKKYGPQKMWYSDGKVKFLKNYLDDVPDGEFWGWHPNGTVSDFYVFKQGKNIVYKSFISDHHFLIFLLH